MSNAITTALIDSLVQEQTPNYLAAQRAVTSNGVYVSSENSALGATNSTVFSDEITVGGVTDQKQTGRCWIFATLNVLRHQIEKDFKIDTFELSQSYLYFWDKLEKSNTFYEQVITTAADPLDDRFVDRILNDPQADGGWWEYSASLIKKYGIVPKHVMTEPATTTNSYQLNVLLNRILRRGALQLRQAVADAKTDAQVQTLKEALLKDVYRFLTISIGTPPSSFEFSYRDKDNKFHRRGTVTPLEFLKEYTRNDLSEYVSVLNDPSPTKEYEQTYQFTDGGNVVDGTHPLLLNVDIETLKGLVLKQLKEDESVWFGCDITKDANKKGFMALDVYDFESTFGVDFSLTKVERLATRDTSVTHAMTITGVDVIDDKAVQWKVENSWGDERGFKGYYTMSDEWFDEHGYIAVIRRNLLPESLQNALKKTPKSIPLWDPLNTLTPN